MAVSVNTNAGAMVALQQLNKTNSEMAMVQSRINTGLKVAGAKDNGGVYAIAQRMRADIAAFGVVANSLDRGISTVDVALAAGEAISDLLVEMKAKALAASDTSLDATSRAALNEDFKALRDQIGDIVSNASFNNFNLINNSTASIQLLASASGAKITVLDENLSLGGSKITLTSTATIGTSAAAATAVTTITTSLNNLNAALARLGTASKSLDIHRGFISKLADETEKGVGNLVDADLAKESARSQALQVKQQLGVQALAIANQAPQSILSFFQ